jgi:predicted alpha/beta-fold hydrolase
MEGWDTGQWSFTTEDVCTLNFAISLSDSIYIDGGAALTFPVMHCAPEVDGFRQAMVYLSYKFPNAPLLGVGFSAGANLGIRYLSEDGPKARLHAMCGVACVSAIHSDNAAGLLMKER